MSIEKLLTERQRECMNGMNQAVITNNRKMFDVHYELFLGAVMIGHSRGFKPNEQVMQQVDKYHKQLYGWN